MKRIEKYSNLFRQFDKLNKKQQKAFIANIDQDQLKAIVEVCLNILNQTLELPPDLQTKLGKYKNKIRTFANCKCPLKKKRKLLKGGFISLILGALASSAVSFALDKLINNNAKTKG